MDCRQAEVVNVVRADEDASGCTRRFMNHLDLSVHTEVRNREFVADRDYESFWQGEDDEDLVVRFRIAVTKTLVELDDG